MAKEKLPIAKTALPSMPESFKLTKEDKDRQRQYAAEDALRICEQYKKNESNKQLMKDVAALAKQKINDLKKIVK